MIGKYDKIVMPIVFNGALVGHFIQKRTAEEYAEEMWEFAQFMKQWDKAMEGATTIKIPIIGIDDE